MNAVSTFYFKSLQNLISAGAGRASNETELGLEYKQCI